MSNPMLPDEVYQVLVEECDKRPGPVRDDRVFGELLNAVAWRTRHLGMGLSRKSGGRHVDSSVGPIAEDVLQRQSDGHHWDVLGAAAVGNTLQPGRGPSIGVMTDPSRPWVAPVQPAGSTPAPPPAGTPPASPPPPSSGSTDLIAIKAQLAALTDLVQVLVSGHAAIEGTVERVLSDLHHLVGHEVVPHLDDVKRIVLKLPREERFR